MISPYSLVIGGQNHKISDIAHALDDALDKFCLFALEFGGRLVSNLIRQDILT